MVHGQRIDVERAVGPAGDALDVWVIRFASAVEAIAGLIIAYRQYRRECKQLAALSDRQLRDLGISRVDALRAARTSFRRRPKPSRASV